MNMKEKNESNLVIGSYSEESSLLENKVNLEKNLNLYGYRVGVVACCTDLSEGNRAENLVNTLLADGRFSSVTLIDGDIAMPTAQELLNKFDVVVAMTDNYCNDELTHSVSVALIGFVNGGGGLIISTFGFSTTIGFTDELFADGLSPFQKVMEYNGPPNIYVDLSTIKFEWLTDGVTAPVHSVFSNFVTLSPGAILLLNYDIESKLPFAAINKAGNIIALNTFLLNKKDNQQESYRRLIGNAVSYIAKKLSRGINFFY